MKWCEAWPFWVLNRFWNRRWKRLNSIFVDGRSSAVRPRHPCVSRRIIKLRGDFKLKISRLIRSLVILAWDWNLDRVHSRSSANRITFSHHSPIQFNLEVKFQQLDDVANINFASYFRSVLKKCQLPSAGGISLEFSGHSCLALPFAQGMQRDWGTNVPSLFLQIGLEEAHKDNDVNTQGSPSQLDNGQPWRAFSIQCQGRQCRGVAPPNVICAFLPAPTKFVEGRTCQTLTNTENLCRQEVWSWRQ